MTHPVVNFGIKTTLPSLGPHCLFDLFNVQTPVSLCFLALGAFHVTQVLGMEVTMQPKLWDQAPVMRGLLGRGVGRTQSRQD